MISKIYEKTLRYIKENYKFLIVMLFILLLFTVSSNYEVYTPGGLIDTSKRIVVGGASKSEGSINMTYVGAKKGTLPILLLSYIMPGWDIENLDDSRYENESYNEIVKRNKLLLQEVNKYSIISAFKAANKEYKITKNDVVIYYVSEDAKTSLKIGDTILSVEGMKIENTKMLTEILNKYDKGDKISISIKRNNKLESAYAYIQEKDGNKLIGIYLITMLEVETNPEVTFDYKNNETGSSGGLMNALAIYDMLIEEDITKGRKIAGTGTLDIDGNVGEVGGIKYKLAGASKAKADIFIVPVKNYNEALKEKEKNNYDITLIKADTFENVLKKIIN